MDGGRDLLALGAIFTILVSCYVFTVEVFSDPQDKKVSTLLASFEHFVVSRNYGLPQTRARAAFRAIHPGRGVFDDFAWLFLPEKRAAVSPLLLWAYDKAFQSIFRLTVEEFSFVQKHIKKMLQRRRDNRGRKPIPVHTIMAAALLYLANGLTYQTTAYSIRNGLSEVLILHCFLNMDAVLTLHNAFV
jgi:hypothetical protein